MVKDQLIPLLVKKSEINYVIKKSSNNYLCISTSNLKFLDVTNYVKAGCTYDEFLAAWDVEDRKSYFPYEWLDSFEKLSYRTFPLYEDFYSSLKGYNTLEGKAGGLTLGHERYYALRRMFEEEGWSIRDWLVYYNNAGIKL